jgi:hypothetical protein
MRTALQLSGHDYVPFGAVRIFGRAATAGAVSAISGLPRFADRTILMVGFTGCPRARL